MSAITEQLAAALGKIKLCASPMDRTFDKMIQDMDWILAEARYALAAYETSKAEGQRKHDPHTGPCPACGFRITTVKRQPLSFEDEPEEWR